jgi:hypothetical protein
MNTHTSIHGDIFYTRERERERAHTDIHGDVEVGEVERKNNRDMKESYQNYHKGMITTEHWQTTCPVHYYYYLKTTLN